MTFPRSAAVISLSLLFQGVPAAWNIEWVDQYGNGASVSASGGLTDATGVYVAGSVFGALPGHAGAGGTDVYLRKYDVAGNVLWTRQFGTSDVDFERNVATDSTGIYFAGRTTGTLPGQASAGGSDNFVRKYDINGDVLWTLQFGTAGFDAPTPNGIAAHETGVYVAGETSGTFPGGPGGSGVDIFIARLNAGTGQSLWVRQFGIRSNFLLSIGGVSADDSGVYVTGTTVLGPGIASLIRKYDFEGNVLWSREFLPGPGLSCSGTLWGISARDGNIYVTGQWDERYFEYAFQEPGTSCGKNGLALGTGTSVGVLLKYDSLGNLLWRRRIKGAGEGANSFTGAKTVWASNTGVYVGANLTGSFPGRTADGPRRDRSQCPGLFTGSSFPDNLDAYVRRYDFDGNVVWTHQFGSDVFDLVNGIGTDATAVYVTGDTSCRLNDEETFSGGNRDAFVLRLAIEPTSPEGRVQLIVGQLETLNDTGRFAPGEFDSLVQQLEATLRAVDGGDLPAARWTLEAFVRTVSTFETKGTLTSTEIDGLIDAANAVMAQL